MFQGLMAGYGAAWPGTGLVCYCRSRTALRLALALHNVCALLVLNLHL